MSIPGFSEWLQTPLGRYVVEWERSQIDTLVADVFGFHALQLGLPSVDFLQNNRICNQYRVAEVGAVHVTAQPWALPLAGQSVDLVVLPHVLEFSAHPHHVLREVDRVLVPEGQVILTGFNPFSLWGLRRRLAGADGPVPWQGQFLSHGRLKDWLELLSFEPRNPIFGAYVPPLTQSQWIERWHFMERIGARSWAIGGGVYILQAIKRVQGMRLITPAWRDQRVAAKKLAPVAQRHNNPTQRVASPHKTTGTQ